VRVRGLVSLSFFEVSFLPRVPLAFLAMCCSFRGVVVIQTAIGSLVQPQGQLDQLRALTRNCRWLRNIRSKQLLCKTGVGNQSLAESVSLPCNTNLRLSYVLAFPNGFLIVRC